MVVRARRNCNEAGRRAIVTVACHILSFSLPLFLLPWCCSSWWHAHPNWSKHPHSVLHHLSILSIQIPACKVPLHLNVLGMDNGTYDELFRWFRGKVHAVTGLSPILQIQLVNMPHVHCAAVWQWARNGNWRDWFGLKTKLCRKG
jgi:hypothetical protein